MRDSVPELVEIDYNKLSAMVANSLKSDKSIADLLNQPALATNGIVSPDGGNADQNIKSFPDFLMAVIRNDKARIQNHYATKAQYESDGKFGGFLVPPQYRDLINGIAIESAIMVKSADAGIKIAMIVGALLSAILKPETKVITVAPIQWQSFIGNKNPTKAEKALLELEIPGKSVSWYKATMRDRRKQKTMDFFINNFGVEVTDNDVGDAMGIAYYAYKNLTER